MPERKKQFWGSRIGLILAMAGSAVGVGNFIRFPIQVIQNGGGSFIIPYLISFVLLGIPLSLIEWSTGKYAGLRGHHNTPSILQCQSRGGFWKYVGTLSIFSSFVISAYYCYIESWCLAYFFHSLLGSFSGLSSAQISQFFTAYVSLGSSSFGIPLECVFFYLVCAAINAYILSRGISSGIEAVAKWMMPLLLVMALVLALKAYTLKAGVDGAVFDGLVGFDFIWYPEFDSLSNPKVWLAAAGQTFFTCSLGMGTLSCYASFMRSNDDVALNGVTACFTNELAEVVLGSAIIIPIAVGYFGIDSVVQMTQNGGFGLGFMSLPFLFTQWGPVWSAVAGSLFFGLMFFACVTSILSMSTPGVEFLVDGYSISRRRAVLIFSVFVAIMGMFTVFCFNQGVFDEFDFWGGTFSLFVGGMLEAILFAWVLGTEKGWPLITNCAQLRLPVALKYVIRYVTPTLLIIIFVAACIKPKNDEWNRLSLSGWELDNGSVLAELSHQGVGPNNQWFANSFFCENSGIVTSVSPNANGELSVSVSGRTYVVPSGCTPCVAVGDELQCGRTLYTGSVVNKVFYKDATRLLFVLLLLLLCFLVRRASRQKSSLF